MLMLITLLNDGTLISIGYDHVKPSHMPEKWNLRVRAAREAGRAQSRPHTLAPLATAPPAHQAATGQNKGSVRTHPIREGLTGGYVE